MLYGVGVMALGLTGLWCFGFKFYVLGFMVLGLMVFGLSFSGCMVSRFLVSCSFGEWFYTVGCGVMVLVLSAIEIDLFTCLFACFPGGLLAGLTACLPASGTREKSSKIHGK